MQMELETPKHRQELAMKIGKIMVEKTGAPVEFRLRNAGFSYGFGVETKFVPWEIAEHSSEVVAEVLATGAWVVQEL